MFLYGPITAHHSHCNNFAVRILHEHEHNHKQKKNENRLFIQKCIATIHNCTHNAFERHNGSATNNGKHRNNRKLFIFPFRNENLYSKTRTSIIIIGTETGVVVRR